MIELDDVDYYHNLRRLKGEVIQNVQRGIAGLTVVWNKALIDSKIMLYQGKLVIWRVYPWYLLLDRTKMDFIVQMNGKEYDLNTP